MIELVTLEEAKLHLRIDDDYGDSDLPKKFRAAAQQYFPTFMEVARLSWMNQEILLMVSRLLAFRLLCWFCLAIWTVIAAAKKKKS